MVVDIESAVVLPAGSWVSTSSIYLNITSIAIMIMYYLLFRIADVNTLNHICSPFYLSATMMSK